MLEKVTVKEFSDCLESTFLMDPGTGQTVRLKLIEARAERVEPGRPPELREPFSLVFLAPRDCLFPQKLYPVRHEKLGSFQLFLVPMGVFEDGVRYSVIFN